MFYAYSTNYLIDTQAGIIMDVEATPAHRTDEVNATCTMVVTHPRFQGHQPVEIPTNRIGRNRPTKDERGRLTAACQAPQSSNNRSAVSLDYFFVAFLAATFFTAFFTAFLAGTALAGEPAIKRLSAVTPFFFNASTNQSGRLPRPDQV